MEGIEDGRRRAVIEGVSPQVDGGRFPIKRTVGERVVVHADVFVDGHDLLSCVVLFRHEDESSWSEAPMRPLANDRWEGEFPVQRMGRYIYTLQAWNDHFRSWRHDLLRRNQPDDIAVALLIGANLVARAAERADGDDAVHLRTYEQTLRGDTSLDERKRTGLDEALLVLMQRYPDRGLATTYEKELTVVVDRERARFGAWYEFFPRSCESASAGHAGFRDCEDRLPYIAAMGFDIIYLPPIHPIGETKRKGPNNSLHAGPGDPGSPWAIGSKYGGHKSIHPQLGTLEDFHRFIAAAEDMGLEVAIDIAFQCSPDHPYVREHPTWFLHRPDGAVQYAENPPKKYEDIYPFHFETDDWESLWLELKDVFRFWVDQGIHIFRVDNPHTKPFAFWEWLIGEVKREHPDTIFLSEAFARPRTMHRLAKLGFSQSYTYFTWRNTKWELQEYMRELTRTEAREYLRPNFWPNTPDILAEYLQFGGRPAFMVRLALAATLTASYGIYGPAYELYDNRPRTAGSEEYLNSEKYQIREWDLRRSDSLRDYVTRINRIRRENPALQQDWNLTFHAVDNNEIVCFSKHTDDQSNIVLVVLSLDPYHVQSGWVELPLEELGVDPLRPYQVHDLLSGGRHLWHGERNFVRLDPQSSPAHIFRLRRHVRTEKDFEYFM